jgi:Flp pilus assembly protein TadG
MKASQRDRQTGAVLVEAAFTLLTLCVFLFGIIEAGRFFQVQQFLTDAAREGARYAVTPMTQTTTLPTATEITTVVQQFASSAAGITPSVDVSCINLSTGAQINSGVCGVCASGTPCGTQVKASSSYQIMSLAMFSNLSITLQGKALMRNETSP